MLILPDAVELAGEIFPLLAEVDHDFGQGAEADICALAVGDIVAGVLRWMP